MSDRPTNIFNGPGLIVTILVIVPLMMLKPGGMAGGGPWWHTFVIAIVGFGAGHLTHYFYWKKRSH